MTNLLTDTIKILQDQHDINETILYTNVNGQYISEEEKSENINNKELSYIKQIENSLQLLETVHLNVKSIKILKYKIIKQTKQLALILINNEEEYNKIIDAIENITIHNNKSLISKFKNIIIRKLSSMT